MTGELPLKILITMEDLENKKISSISDAGWEQMKNDSDYEVRVLGYTAENRSVRNTFFGWPGA